eukprot:TRINITY_DN15752_c0_g1_i1.p1 TRINITY_DN15752_c0_g1~~TRINITY_DN15752_c0_g1_i1.p1  ORF type:complete len:175 (+),score=37.93 TRINITY_DN15752_c0_g1_i1:57-581(+)
MMKMSLCLALCLVCFIGLSTAEFTCYTTANGGKLNNFTDIISANSYTWKGPLENGTVYTFQVQICGAIQNPLPGCPANSAVNMIMEGGSCVSLGDPNVYSWDVSPSRTGVRLTYYHGSAFNNIGFYQSTLYLGCDPTTSISPIQAEHERTCTDSADNLELGGYFHFFIKTKYAC